MSTSLIQGSDVNAGQVLQAHKTVRRQIEFVMDNRLQSTEELIGKYSKLSDHAVELYDGLVQNFQKKNYTREEALSSASEVFMSPWFTAVASIGV